MRQYQSISYSIKSWRIKCGKCEDLLRFAANSISRWLSCRVRSLFFASFGSALRTGQYQCSRLWVSQPKSVCTSPAHKPDNTSPAETQLLSSRRERWIFENRGMIFGNQFKPIKIKQMQWPIICNLTRTNHRTPFILPRVGGVITKNSRSNLETSHGNAVFRTNHLPRFYKSMLDQL